MPTKLGVCCLGSALERAVMCPPMGKRMHQMVMRCPVVGARERIEIVG